MNNRIAKIALPALLTVGSLGLGTLATIPAGASTKPAHTVKASVTLNGSVVKTNVAKTIFWFKVGAKTYRASITSTTKFVKGTSASLIKGAAVTVTGHYVGKSKSVLVASSISA